MMICRRLSEVRRDMRSYLMLHAGLLFQQVLILNLRIPFFFLDGLQLSVARRNEDDSVL